MSAYFCVLVIGIFGNLAWLSEIFAENLKIPESRRSFACFRTPRVVVTQASDGVVVTQPKQLKQGKLPVVDCSHTLGSVITQIIRALLTHTILTK